MRSKKKICETCGKSYVAYIPNQRYCNRECSPVKKSKPDKELECKFCKHIFVSKRTVSFCCDECRRLWENRDYVERWSKRNYQEMHAKKVKTARRIQPLIGWAATEVRDPVSKRLKVMRG